MRIGEVAGLHWSHVDLAARRIEVEHVRLATGQIKPWPKGRKVRSVRIPHRLAELLVPPADVRRPCGLVHLDRRQREVACPGSPLVFTGPQGAPVDAHNWRRRVWAEAVKAARVPPGRQHDLRHSFVTFLAASGVSMDEIAALVGHTSAWISERYKHLSPGYGAHALEVLDGVCVPDRPAPDATPEERRRAFRVIS